MEGDFQGGGDRKKFGIIGFNLSLNLPNFAAPLHLERHSFGYFSAAVGRKVTYIT